VFLKRYVLSFAAALAVALATAGGALAKGHHAGTHHAKRHHARRHHAGSHRSVTGPRDGLGVILSFEPLRRAWLQALREFTRTPTAPQKPKQPRRQPPKTQPRPQHPLRATTLSIYEHTARPRILSRQGCSAARRHESGIVVLDFGKPAFVHGGYGTILFSGHFAPNRRITNGMLGYARGYVSCLPAGSTASIEIARGTSNYHPLLPSAYAAGVRWARETNRLGLMLTRNGLGEQVEPAAADDAEPAWDPHFRKTRDFFHGFRASVHGHTLYDYGSLDGGVGVVWSARQAWFVAGGLRHTKALPEIYNSAMADEWAELARIAHGRYHRDVQFAGVMTQGTASCNCGLRPPAAHHVLAQALESQGVDDVSLPTGGTNIVG
jgi:hypothetical protein